MRDLDAAQRARVYSHTLIKVMYINAPIFECYLSMNRFPDRVILQGFFHPRENADLLYSWVAGCLVKELASTSSYTFELYTTPPRKVLDSPLTAGKRRARVQEDNIKTFFDLNLVPAAKIYVAWKESFKSSYRCISLKFLIFLEDSVIGDYLSSEAKLLQCSLNSLLSFPRSVPLMSERNLGVDSSLKDLDSAAEPKSSGENVEKKASKPKWLKI